MKKELYSAILLSLSLCSVCNGSANATSPPSAFPTNPACNKQQCGGGPNYSGRLEDSCCDGLKCYRKNTFWAVCRESCPTGGEEWACSSSDSSSRNPSPAPPTEVEHYCVPTQLHLSPGTPADTTLWVSWITRENCTSTVVLPEEEGLSGATHRFSGPFVAKQYTTNDRIAGSYQSDFVHHVFLSGLAPGKQYTYQAGGRLASVTNAEEAFGAPIAFTTLSAAKGDTPIRIALVVSGEVRKLLSAQT